MQFIKKALLFFQKYLAFPLVLLGIYGLVFGIQISKLGFYLDDWIILHAYKSGGVDRLVDYAFLATRPFIAWIWIMGFKLCDVSPLSWQLFTLLWRYITVLLFWVTLRLLFPRQKLHGELAALGFALYPLFKQQPAVISFIHHWVCFSLFFLSLIFMILAVKKQKYYLLFSCIAVLLSFVELYSLEYFVGLEILRPFILFYLIRDRLTGDKKKTTLTVFLHALPYLIVLFSFVFWRMIMLPSLAIQNVHSARNVYALVSNPFQTILKLSSYFIKDMITGVIKVWNNVIDLDSLSVSPISNLISWVISLGIFFGLSIYFYFSWKESSEDINFNDWLIFGFIFAVVGFAPSWAIDHSINELPGLYNDRFGLAAMPGLALIVIGILFYFSRQHKYAIFVTCILLSLSAGWLFRATSVYRWSWEKQTRFDWQLKWRAPDIQAPAALYGNGALSYSMGSWASVSSLDQMYAPGQTGASPYWVLDAYKLNRDAFSGAVLHEEVEYLYFSAPRTNALVYQFNPEEGRCLWVLEPEDRDNSYLEPQIKAIVKNSRLDMIKKEEKVALNPTLFGQEPAHDWCYYYEKSALARQYGEWDQVVRLWEEAQRKDFMPHNGIEYWPAIEAYARAGDREKALSLTKSASVLFYDVQTYLCGHWQQTIPYTNGKISIQDINDLLKCGITQ